MKKKWTLSDVEAGGEYVLALVEDAHGFRGYGICSEKDKEFNRSEGGVKFFTKTAPNEKLKCKDFISISEEISLEDGSRFYCTAHGIWITQDERDDLRAGKPVRWVCGRPPKNFG